MQDNISEERIKELEDQLIAFAESKENLNQFNPYIDPVAGKVTSIKDDKATYDRLNSLIEKFIDIYDNHKQDSFSWIEGFNEISKDKEGKAIEITTKLANLHYALPNHIHGNIEEGVIYCCLLNPGVNTIEDKASTSDFTCLKDYFEQAGQTRQKEQTDIKSNQNNEDNSCFGSQEDPEYILKGDVGIIGTPSQSKEKNNKQDRIKHIKENFISFESDGSKVSSDSVFTKELRVYIKRRRNKKLKEKFNAKPKAKKTFEQECKEGLYYISNYYNQICMAKGFYKKGFFENKSFKEIKEIFTGTNKLVNIELFPFRSKSGTFAGCKINKFSLFGAYIILFRIGLYYKGLYENKEINPKPVFIFRTFAAYEKIIKKAIKTCCKKDKHDIDDKEVEGFFQYLYGEFFFEFASRNGAITVNNVGKKDRSKKRHPMKEKLNQENFEKLIAELL